jgi:hypothetical protein
MLLTIATAILNDPAAAEDVVPWRFHDPGPGAG